MGNLLFIRPSSMNSLEADMIVAKQRFPQLQILFVIINRKGDPAYGKRNVTCFLIYKAFFIFFC